MRLQYNIELGKQEFEQPKDSMPIFQDGIITNDYIYFVKIIEKFRRDLLYKLNDISIEDKMSISLLLEEPFNNSFDTCKDKFLENKDFLGQLTIYIITNTQRKVITIILKDNGAGKNASRTDEKKYDPEFLGGRGKGLIEVTKGRTDNYKLEKDYNGATIMLRKKID